MLYIYCINQVKLVACDTHTNDDSYLGTEYVTVSLHNNMIIHALALWNFDLPIFVHRIS